MLHGLLSQMIFRAHVPAPPLSHFVAQVWFCEGYAPAHEKERILPDGSIQIAINLRENLTRFYDRGSTNECESLRGAVISGAHSEFAVIDTAEQASVMGVQFKPGGAYPFLGMPASELRNRHVSLDALWGAGGVDLRDQLLEASTPEAKFRIVEKALLAQASDSLAGHPALEYALVEFQKRPNLRTISSVTHSIGISKRRFIQVFNKRVGLTPKLFCRVRRFQSALRLIAKGGKIEWADLAVDCGYFDQAHFIHDFTDFSGLNPSAFVHHRTEHLNHVRLPE
ncbi:MAG: helix-turn-helix domain-containing protein [Terriglobia bacterium]|jgi:AraC-like DNA-binding protein